MPIFHQLLLFIHNTCPEMLANECCRHGSCCHGKYVQIEALDIYPVAYNNMYVCIIMLMDSYKYYTHTHTMYMPSSKANVLSCRHS